MENIIELAYVESKRRTELQSQTKLAFKIFADKYDDMTEEELDAEYEKCECNNGPCDELPCLTSRYWMGLI